MVDLRYRANSGAKNFSKRIKVPIFLEAVLAIEMLQEPQLNSRIDPSIFTSIVHPDVFWAYRFLEVSFVIG